MLCYAKSLQVLLAITDPFGTSQIGHGTGHLSFPRIAPTGPGQVLPCRGLHARNAAAGVVFSAARERAPRLGEDVLLTWAGFQTPPPPDSNRVRKVYVLRIHRRG